MNGSHSHQITLRIPIRVQETSNPTHSTITSSFFSSFDSSDNPSFLENFTSYKYESYMYTPETKSGRQLCYTQDAAFTIHQVHLTTCQPCCRPSWQHPFRAFPKHWPKCHGFINISVIWPPCGVAIRVEKIQGGKPTEMGKQKKFEKTAMGGKF